MLYKYTVFPYNSFHAVAQEDEPYKQMCFFQHQVPSLSSFLLV